MSPIQRIIRKARGGAIEESQAAASAPEIPADLGRYRYFFISGHPRSGTNWLSALVNLHPDVCCHGEFHFHIMRQALDGFASLPWYVASQEPVKTEAHRAFEDFVKRCLVAMGTQRKPGARVVGDHTPRPMRSFLSDGRYLVIRRDGRDVLVSWTFHLLKTARAEVVNETIRPVLARAIPAAGPSATEAELRQAAAGLLADEHWVRHFAHTWSAHVLRDEGTAHELARTGSARVLKLRYEDLHASTDSWRTAVYEFLGVNPGAAAPLSSNNFTAPGFKREDPRSFYRKGEVGDWVNHLTDAAAAWFTDEAAEAMSALGYAANAQAAPAPSAGVLVHTGENA